MIKKLLCRQFGHKYQYYKSSALQDDPKVEIRICKRCMLSQIYTQHNNDTMWITMPKSVDNLRNLWRHHLRNIPPPNSTPKQVKEWQAYCDNLENKYQTK